MAKKKTQEDYGKSLADSYAQWEHYYVNGGQDPFWPDGTNLNLIINHIRYYKGKIEETMQPEDYPEIYHHNLPPEVPQEYMARPEEIREAAKASLGRYLTDPDYQFLCRRVDGLNPKQAKEIHIRNVIGYAEGLEKAIQTDDLVSMRRHRNSDYYIESFSSCAEKVRNWKPPENEQLNLFNMVYDDEQEFEDEDEMEY
jgi:hypothetical protein